ncbi:hypothetical protein LXL04_032935 [Taraxacum kok-saghyz]
MSPNLHSPDEQLLYIREFCPNITKEYLSHLRDLVYESDQQARYNKPMPWIGIYIAVVSLFCIIAMVADLLHGFRNTKLWFPCKYFTLNAASLTLIAVAVKLPMDLTNLMPGYVDQAAKLGSVAFTCTMMANLLPSIATMDNKELVSNIIALGVLWVQLPPFLDVFASVSFKLSVGWIWNHIRVSLVESYWTQKLYDWKQSSTPFPYSSRKCKIATQHLKILILSICIGFQKTIVVACKLIAMIPVFFVICVVYSFRCWKWLDVFSREELFAELISIIADILAACLSNLPQVIVMKCHTSSIEKRETNVYAAVQLLGETNQIINALNLRKLPSLNPNELAFIEKWRAYLSGPFP